MYQRLKRLTNEYKILRGMLSYGTLWPIGNLLEQTLVEKRNIHTYDWQKCMRISLHGTLFMGPMMFMWMRFVSRLYPGRSLRSSVSKAISEQVTFDPMAIVVFLFVMTVAEGNSAAMAREEVRERSREHYVVQKPYKCVLICVHPHGIQVRTKFFDTYRIGAVYWPVVQTFNFTFIPVKNQVVFTSFFSMLWSSFLAYMKHLEQEC